MLAAERLVANHGRSNRIGQATLAGTTLLFVGGMVWVFTTPALYGPGNWLSTAGILITGAAVLGTVWYGGLAAFIQSSRGPRPQLKPIAH
jgi:hypothetical protein